MTEPTVPSHLDTDPDDVSTNPSTTTPFAEIAERYVSRRNVLVGGLATAAAAFLTPHATALAAPPRSDRSAPTASTTPARGGLLGYDAIAPTQADTITVPPGYTAEVLIPWGTALQPGGPGWRLDNTAEEQLQQLGQGHDGMHFFPLGNGRAGSRRGLLVVNHEYTTGDAFAALADPEARARKDIAAQGLSVVEVAEVDGTWQVVGSRYARRITALTEMALSGPAAGGRLVRTDADPDGRTVYGTVNNCSHGVTPWGTYLACEENFQNYFRAADSSRAATDAGLTEEQREQRTIDRRLGITGNGPGWQIVDARFDLNVEPREVNRFGWVVEFDPMDPGSVPTKRTALGRFKHEGAIVTEGRGKRVVVYTGDDQAGDYFYKFVGDGNWQSQRARGRSPLDHGTLYVARFDEDGRGRWLPLVHGEGPLTADNGFADQSDVLVKTRLAADALGATPMDRAEWAAVDPRSADVYFTCTNNSNASAPPNAANLRRPNHNGHIVRIAEHHADNASSDAFRWDLYLLAGTGEGTGDGSTIPADQAFGSPDGLWFDDDGRLWIQTDGNQPTACNDQMLASDPDTGDLRRFLVGPRGCEVTGVITTPDQRTMFVNIQHPGNGNPAVSTWPDGGHPRPATVVIRREDGGVIGAR